jgi:hypothetical protein
VRFVAGCLTDGGTIGWWSISSSKLVELSASFVFASSASANCLARWARVSRAGGALSTGSFFALTFFAAGLSFSFSFSFSSTSSFSTSFHNSSFFPTSISSSPNFPTSLVNASTPFLRATFFVLFAFKFPGLGNWCKPMPGGILGFLASAGVGSAMGGIGAVGLVPGRRTRAGVNVRKAFLGLADGVSAGGTEGMLASFLRAMVEGSGMVSAN